MQVRQARTVDMEYERQQQQLWLVDLLPMPL